jgi:hypothetical protein
MPEPPARVRATKPTRQSTVSMPVCSARPPETPPSMRSVPLRRSGGRAGWGCAAGGRSDGAEKGADVMPRSLSAGDPADHG